MPAPSKRPGAHMKSRSGGEPHKQPSSDAAVAGSKRAGVKQESDATAPKAKAASVVSSSKPRNVSPDRRRYTDKSMKTPPAQSDHDSTSVKAKEAAKVSSEGSLIAEADAKAKKVVEATKVSSEGPLIAMADAKAKKVVEAAKVSFRGP